MMGELRSVDGAEWENFTSTREIHLLQTASWGELKKRFGWRVERVTAGGFGAQILFKPLPLGYTVAYIPKLSISMYFNLDVFSEGIDEICRANNAVFLKVELDVWQDDLLEFSLPRGYNFSDHSIQPPNTILVDITGEEQDVLARMKQKFRYNIKLAAKKGVVVERSNDVGAFHEIMRETGGRDGFNVHSQDYYQAAFDLFDRKGDVALLIAKYEHQPIAGVMAFARGNRAYYLYGASSNAERNRMPAYLAQWEAVIWAREKGCKEYDLWGIPDASEEELEANFETRSDDLWGVYRFKRGFGGNVRRSLNSLDRVYSATLYKTYLLRQKLRGIPE